MTTKSKALGLSVLVLGLLAICAFFYFDDSFAGTGDGSDDVSSHSTADDLTGDRTKSVEDAKSEDGGANRAKVARDPAAIIGVRGVVLDVKTRLPLAGVEVVALRMLPNLERPITRLRSLFTEGIWTDTSKPVKILGSAFTNGDGTFEMYGLPPGRVFLDARSDRAFIRNPGSVRLARGQVQEGIELLASPGGRIVGRVFGPEGNPAKNTRVSVRPGLNSLLGQLTQRKYKWLEVMTDEEGRFIIPGVPTGDGYSVTIASQEMALEERHGIDINLGQTVEMTIHGQIGASVTGRAIDADGGPVSGAQIAMMYLDVSRLIFSADGREEPITTDENGYFQLQHVARGRVAFIAATESLAPSNIHELAVVDGGVYDDVILTLDKGRSFSGIVVDGNAQPISGVDVEIRPMDFGERRGGQQRRGSDAMKILLKIRRVQTETGSDGRFSTSGIAGDRLSLRFTKPGYISIRKRGTKVDEKDFTVVLTRGVTVRGKVQLADGTPVTRYRVRLLSSEIQPENVDSKKQGKDAKPVAAEKGAVKTGRKGVTVDVGVGGGSGRARRGRENWRSGTTRTREGRTVADRDMESDWDEVKSVAGRFSIDGVPCGKIKVQVQADGYLKPKSQSIELAPGEAGEELVFIVELGAIGRGIVKDESTGLPVAEATVTAYKAKKKKDKGFALFRPNVDEEDFDFFGMAGKEGRQSSMTDSKGRFEITGLKGGDYRFTARHPDMAKTSIKDVKIAFDRPTEGIEIMLTVGGAIEGIVTGKGKLPLSSAMVVAFSISAGSFKSDATDARGFYRIDGLPKGQYIVFKSRMDEHSQDIGMDLMNNMRLKTTMVRANKTSRRDIHDETDDSVRIFGVVRDDGKPVPRSVITFLGRDRDGILGMGIRTKSTEDDGSYEIIGIEPGDYLLQVARFSNRAEKSNVTVEIPSGVREFRLDIDLPQSYIEGIVQDTSGNPVAKVQVNVGLQEDAPIDGLIGIMLKNGIAQARTDENGQFKIKGLAPGVYRVTASGRGASFGNRGLMPQVRAGGKKGDDKWGEVALENVQLDGVSPRTGVVMTLPRAGSITGIVINGEGVPIAGASLTATSEDRRLKRAKSQQKALTDLFGLQITPTKSGADGRFEINGMTPGKFRVRADVEGLAPGTVDDVTVVEGQTTEIRIQVIKGATLKVRVRNINGNNMPIANISVFDSKGKPLANNVSVMSVFLKYMKGRKKKDSSGWHDIGGIPPDTYTMVIKEKGQPDMTIVRTIKDGEEARWDIDMAEELKRHKASKK
jgi:protocatechuate 3,4-dioxygenase beta subunit